MALAAIGACIIGNWFEGAMLTFIFCLSGALEEYTTNKSKKEIASLMNLQPEIAFLLDAAGNSSEVAVSKLKINDSVLVPKGTSIPIDGILLQGKRPLMKQLLLVNQFLLKKAGEELFGGTINLENTVIMRVTTNSENTLFAKIIRLVEEAQHTPSQTANFINRLESVYVKIVLIGIPLMILLPYLFLGWSWNESFYRGMVLLVVASLCVSGFSNTSHFSCNI